MVKEFWKSVGIWQVVGERVYFWHKVDPVYCATILDYQVKLFTAAITVRCEKYEPWMWTWALLEQCNMCGVWQRLQLFLSAWLCWSLLWECQLRCCRVWKWWKLHWRRCLLVMLLSSAVLWFVTDSFFSARCNIYISRLCYDVSVRLSVTEVHWRIIANLGFKFRSQFTMRCMRAWPKGSSPGRVEGSSCAMLATARPSCLSSYQAILPYCWCTYNCCMFFLLVRK